MRITKLEHATTLVEVNGRTLVIDPGSFTRPIDSRGTVDAVVVTHGHGDHWTSAHLASILESSPEAVVFGPRGVVESAQEFNVVEVSPEETRTAGEFVLQFFGGAHAPIHSSMSTGDNVGVLVNQRLYYPGDSLYVPDGIDIDILAAPAGGPWMDLGSGMDFVLAAKPRNAFYTHEALLSPAGVAAHSAKLAWAVEQNGGVFVELAPGDSMDC